MMISKSAALRSLSLAVLIFDYYTRERDGSGRLQITNTSAAMSKMGAKLPLEDLRTDFR